jgi:beta-glucanase (GH16 family)
MEMKGQEPKIDHGAVHGLNTNYSEWTYHATTTSTTPLAGQWHTYAMLWQPGVVETLVDGRPFMAVTPADVSGADIWPFDSQPFVLRMQLAVGGDFVGAPSRSTVFPANMLVDWVRVTQ